MPGLPSSNTSRGNASPPRQARKIGNQGHFQTARHCLQDTKNQEGQIIGRRPIDKKKWLLMISNHLIFRLPSALPTFDHPSENLISNRHTSGLIMSILARQSTTSSETHHQLQNLNKMPHWTLIYSYYNNLSHNLLSLLIPTNSSPHSKEHASFQNYLNPPADIFSRG